MHRHTRLVLAWLTLLSFVIASPALADHHGGKHEGKQDTNGHAGHAMSTDSPGDAKATDKAKGPSPEQRAKMAAAHERMAACLRSNRPIQECHGEMRAACKESGGQCGMGHHGRAGHSKGDLSACSHGGKGQCDGSCKGHHDGQCSAECKHHCDAHGEGQCTQHGGHGGQNSGKPDAKATKTPDAPGKPTR